MPELKAWRELRTGGVVIRDRPSSRGPAAGAPALKPEVDLAVCVELPALLALLPRLGDRRSTARAFAGFDLDYCKGCELCAEVCPTGAIEMVADDD